MTVTVIDCLFGSPCSQPFPGAMPRRMEPVEDALNVVKAAGGNLTLQKAGKSRRWGTRRAAGCNSKGSVVPKICVASGRPGNVSYRQESTARKHNRAEMGVLLAVWWPCQGVTMESNTASSVTCILHRHRKTGRRYNMESVPALGNWYPV